jgi:hypothetical protein
MLVQSYLTVQTSVAFKSYENLTLVEMKVIYLHHTFPHAILEMILEHKFEGLEVHYGSSYFLEVWSKYLFQ